MAEEFRRGDFVTVTYCEQTVKAMVALASKNGRSLMLVFEGGLYNGQGVFVGAMPVLQNNAAQFKDLLEPANPVEIQHE